MELKEDIRTGFRGGDSGFLVYRFWGLILMRTFCYELSMFCPFDCNLLSPLTKRHDEQHTWNTLTLSPMIMSWYHATALICQKIFTCSAYWWRLGLAEHVWMRTHSYLLGFLLQLEHLLEQLLMAPENYCAPLCNIESSISQVCNHPVCRCKPWIISKAFLPGIFCCAFRDPLYSRFLFSDLAQTRDANIRIDRKARKHPVIQLWGEEPGNIVLRWLIPFTSAHSYPSERSFVAPCAMPSMRSGLQRALVLCERSGEAVWHTSVNRSTSRGRVLPPERIVQTAPCVYSWTGSVCSCLWVLAPS